MLDHQTTPGAEPACDTVRMLQDRRRPGRLEEVSPALVQLIREDMLSSDTLSQLPIPWQEEAIDDDDLGPIRAIMFAAALSLPLWAAIGIGIEYLME